MRCWRRTQQPRGLRDPGHHGHRDRGRRDHDPGYVDIPGVVRKALEEIGYTRAKYGFDSEVSGVLTAIQEQSPDIAMGVDVGGAGDQGMMFGYRLR